MMTDQNSEENLGYRSHPAIANSDLKYLHSPKQFRLNKDQELLEETKKYHTTGIMIDEYLLDRDRFNEQFVFKQEFEEEPTSKNQKEFVELLFRLDDPFDADEETVAKLHDKCYSTSTKAKAIKMYNDFIPYMRFKKAAEEKTPYGIDDRQMLKKIDENCRSHMAIGELLYANKPHFIRKKHYQIIGMPKWGIKWKGELDFFVVDKRFKIIYNIDIKSTAKPISDFAYFYDRYDYGRQQALYRELLLWDLIKRGIIRKDNLAAWTVKTKVLVAEKEDLNEVHLVPIPFQMIEKGQRQLKKSAKLLKYYQKNGWNRTRSYLENNGEEVLNWEEYYG